MNEASLLALVAAACEGVGIGLIGAVAMRLVCPRNTVSSLMGALAITMAAMGMSAIVISVMGGAPGIAVDLIVICLTGVIALGLGLRLGGSVLGVGTGRWAGRSTLAPTPREELAKLGRKLADVDNQFTQLSRDLAATRTTIAKSQQQEQTADAERWQLVTWFSRTLHAPVVRLADTVESAVDDLAPGLLADVQRLERTVDNLHHLAQIQAGSLCMNPASVGLKDLVSEAVAGLGGETTDGGVNLCTGAIEPVMVSADRREMAWAIKELLTNAIRCGGPRSTVSVDVRTCTEHAVVSISDECGGIPEKDLGSVFEVAWRGADTEGGGGVGLAIVQAIVRPHHGAVEARNIPGGCCFEIRIPVTGGG